MIDIATARRWIGDSLKAAGFSGSRSSWRRMGDDVQWLVHIDRPPLGKKLGLEVGLDLQANTKQTRANDCPIILYPEVMPATKELQVLRVFDFESTLDDSARHLEIEEIVARLGRYVSNHLTIESIRDSYQRGDLNSGFIHRDARKLLEAK